MRDVSHEDDAHEDARRYYPLRALILYEEAQALGIVPKFHPEEDHVYDIRDFPPAAAEVAVLTLLRVFRRYADSRVGEGDARVAQPGDAQHDAAGGRRVERPITRAGTAHVQLIRLPII